MFGVLGYFEEKLVDLDLTEISVSLDDWFSKELG